MVTQIAEQMAVSTASISLSSLPSQVQRRPPLIYDESTRRPLEIEGQVEYEPSRRIIASWLACRPEISKATAQYLVGDGRKIYDVLLAILCTKGTLARVQPKSIKLYEFYNPEEGDRQLVFQVEVKARPASALAYWHAVGRAIDDWRQNLPIWLRDKVTEQWSMRILW